jgi:hypothetical protein
MWHTSGPQDQYESPSAFRQCNKLAFMYEDRLAPLVSLLLLERHSADQCCSVMDTLVREWTLYAAAVL